MNRSGVFRTWTITVGGACALFGLAMMAGCSGRHWSEVSEIPFKSPLAHAIKAGSTFRIEPVQFAPAMFSGKDFAESDFVFRCRTLQKGVETEYVGTSTLVLKGLEETQPGHPEKWAPADDAKEIRIHYVVLPTMGFYTGEGSLYFYLRDKDKNCVSNIVAWPVAFR